MKKSLVIVVLVCLFSSGCVINNSMGARLGWRDYQERDVDSLAMIECFYEMTLINTVDVGGAVSYAKGGDFSSIATTVYGLYRMDLTEMLVLRAGLGMGSENLKSDTDVKYKSATGLDLRVGLQMNLASMVKPEIGIIRSMSKTTDKSNDEDIKLNPMIFYIGIGFGF